MADLSITAALVVPVADVNGNVSPLFPNLGVAGETITQGMPVYRKASDGLLYKAIITTEATAECVGIALASVSAGQSLPYWSEGDINLGATLVRATTYIVSVNAGGIAPNVDLASSSYLTYLCFAVSTTAARMMLNPTRVTKA